MRRASRSTAGKMYFSSATLNKIERGNLDGTNRESIITGSGAIFRIAFIPQSVDCDSNGVPDECQPDADGDRVPDACDACANTIAGATVDATGCPPQIPADSTVTATAIRATSTPSKLAQRVRVFRARRPARPRISTTTATST